MNLDSANSKKAELCLKGYFTYLTGPDCVVCSHKEVSAAWSHDGLIVAAAVRRVALTSHMCSSRPHTDNLSQEKETQILFNNMDNNV